MRPLLRRPRFEEKNKKENKIQHNFLDRAAKKNQTQAMCLLFRRRRFERNCRKSKWQPHPTFFSGWWLSHDWICWVMRCLLSQVILLEKIRETLGPQTKTNTECMQSTPLGKKWGFCRTACSLSLVALKPATHCTYCGWKGCPMSRGVVLEQNSSRRDKQWIRITGTRDAPALAPPALRRKK